LDLNELHLVIMSGTKLLIVDKSTGSKLYQGAPLDSSVPFGIKMIKDTCVVGDDHGNISFIKKDPVDESWRVDKYNESNLRGVTCIEGNEDFLAFGTRSGVYLWDVKEMQLVESSNNRIKVQVWNMAMMYPNVFVVSGGGFEGLKVFNLETGECIRDYQYNEKMFHEVHSNGRFLIISEFNGNFFKILDMQELINETIEDNDLWEMISEKDICYNI